MPKIDTKEIIKAASALSLGISMAVAIVIGVAIGIGLKTLFNMPILLWVGVIIGICASFLNVYKAYKEQVKSYDMLKDDPRYKNYKSNDDDDDDDK